MQANDQRGAIVVTGATGWMGLTVIQELYRIFSRSEALARIYPFASQQTSIRIDSRTLIPVQPLQKLSLLASHAPIDILIHCAFLTPDKFCSLGADQFIAINKLITHQVRNALRLNQNARVVSLSSGVARFATEKPSMAEASAKEVYGWLKLEEESRLREQATTLILRIFALTGSNMRNPRQYALGDFIYQALMENHIVLRSNRRIIRGYAPAAEIAKLAILWALSPAPAPREPIDAVGHIIELTELAEMVSHKLAAGRPIYSLDPDLPIDSYAANPDEFLMLLERFNMTCPSLEMQIDQTCHAFSR